MTDRLVSPSSTGATSISSDGGSGAGAEGAVEPPVSVRVLVEEIVCSWAILSAAAAA